MRFFHEQSAAAQSAYAGLAQAARHYERERSLADLPGSFVTKRIKGRTYHYYQYKAPDRAQQQFYIGPDDEETRQLIAGTLQPERSKAHQHQVTLCRAAQALGCFTVITRDARVLGCLANHGFFRAGSILVSDHAYLAYQNRFGVCWEGAATLGDLHRVHPDGKIALALPREVLLDDHGLPIERLLMGFLPVNARTHYVKPDDSSIDLEFLTSLHRGGRGSVVVPSLNVSLQPRIFMDFLLVDPLQIVLPSSLGPIVANVPRPERYALTKLLTYGDRAQRNAEKAAHDLRQAATLLAYLQAHHSDALALAWLDLQSRGARWCSRAAGGIRALGERFPGLTGVLTPPLKGKRF